MEGTTYENYLLFLMVNTIKIQKNSMSSKLLLLSKTRMEIGKRIK